MAFKIVISDEAELQMKEAHEYYKEIDVELAERFDNELIKSMSYISENPLFFSKKI